MITHFSKSTPGGLVGLAKYIIKFTFAAGGEFCRASGICNGEPVDTRDPEYDAQEAFRYTGSRYDYDDDDDNISPRQKRERDSFRRNEESNKELQRQDNKERREAERTRKANAELRKKVVSLNNRLRDFTQEAHGLS